MNIGIVTTWFERGAAYVSRQYMKILEKDHNVFIYARSGEEYAVGNKEWNLPNVYWSKKINSPFIVTVIDKQEFIRWIKQNKIQTIIFNEQHWWEPLIWCRELGIKTIAYIDYYTEQTLPLFEIYDMLICNTRKHYDAFNWHPGAKFIPWGTDVELFQPAQTDSIPEVLSFFHSCGMNPKRKGTDLLLNAIPLVKSEKFTLIIHTQVDLITFYPELQGLIASLQKENKLKIIHKTVNAPGLYSKGQIYVYPSRLEGIGLTVAEAISSGLGVIVPDCGPMNEFVGEGFGSVVKIDKYFCRHDGYYWPQNEIDISNLADVMEEYISNIDGLLTIKRKAREYALENLDWRKNGVQLNILVNELCTNYELIDKTRATRLVRKFEGNGLRKYNNYYLKYPYFFQFLNKIKK